MKSKEEARTYSAEISTNLFVLGVFYFNWKIITLQYCDGLCYTLT